MQKTPKTSSEKTSSFKEAILNKRMLICIFTGFSSGLPLFVLYQLIPGWLRDEGVSLTEIGLFTLIGIPYVWKFLWSPLMDRYSLGLLGRRRSWMLATQLLLLGSIASFGFVNPVMDIWSVAYLAAAVAFFSASQDIVLDAYRRELLPDNELGLGNSIHVQAYRLSGLVPGSNRYPSWSPDGSHIIFTSTKGGKSNLVSVSNDGKIAKQLTTNGISEMAAWSDF